MGAPFAARSFVAGGAFGAVYAARARGRVAGSVACLDVGGTVLAGHEANTRGRRRSEGPRFECDGQSLRGAIEMEAGARWRE
eukprot:scaffold84692_cov66-Phaeocystis_antarctica.AAC.8